MNKEISKKITFFSTIMSFAIVLYHTAGLFSSEKIVFLGHTDELLYKAFTSLFSLGAPLALAYFFTTSAFLFYRNLDHDNLNEKMKKRLITLGIPFLIWNCIEMLFLMITDEYEIDSISQFLLGFSFIPFDGPTWYIFALLLFFYVTSFFVAQIDNCSEKAFILFGAFLTIICWSISIYYFQCENSTIIPYYYERIIRYFPYFYFGIWLATFREDKIFVWDKYRRFSNVSRLLFLISIVYIISVGGGVRTKHSCIHSVKSNAN